MRAFETYKQMEIERRTIQSRIEWLEHCIERLNDKYLSMRSCSIMQMPDKNGAHKDKAVEYCYELYYKKQRNGMCIAKEYEYQKNELNLIEEKMLQMQDNISRLDGIHAKIYEGIVFKGKSVSDTMKYLSMKENYALSTMYKFFQEVKPYMNNFIKK